MGYWWRHKSQSTAQVTWKSRIRPGLLSQSNKPYHGAEFKYRAVTWSQDEETWLPIHKQRCAAVLISIGWTGLEVHHCMSRIPSHWFNQRWTHTGLLDLMAYLVVFSRWWRPTIRIPKNSQTLFTPIHLQFTEQKRWSKDSVPLTLHQSLTWNMWIGENIIYWLEFSIQHQHAR